MTVRPERWCVARYREVGHRKKGKAEDPEIEARRDDPIPSWLQDHIAVAVQKNIPICKQPQNEQSGRPHGTSSEDDCGTSCSRSMRSAPPLVTVLSSVHFARKRMRCVGRRAQPVKTAGEQSRARHEPEVSWPVDLNYSIFPEFRGSPSVAF